MYLRYAILIALISFFTSCTKESDFDLSDDGQDSSIIDNSEFSDLEPTVLEIELFDLVNEYRESKNLSKFIFDKFTYSEALRHNKFMISQGERSHANFNSRASNISEKMGAQLVAENIADNYNTINAVLEAWKESEGHRKNLEADFTHSAISIKEDAKGKLYFTQIFFK